MITINFYGGSLDGHELGSPDPWDNVDYLKIGDEGYKLNWITQTNIRADYRENISVEPNEIVRCFSKITKPEIEG